MKQITVKTIYDLTEEEVTEFLKNEIVQHEILVYAMDSEETYVSEMLDYIRNSLKDYSIGAFAYHNYINVDLNKAGDFIDGLYKLQEHFLLMDNLDIHELLKETETIYNEYIFSDMFSDKYIELENILEENVNELANTLLTEMVVILEYYSDFETVELESDYINDYLDGHYDTEVAITDKGVTFITY